MPLSGGGNRNEAVDAFMSQFLAGRSFRSGVTGDFRRVGVFRIVGGDSYECWARKRFGQRRGQSQCACTKPLAGRFHCAGKVGDEPAFFFVDRNAYTGEKLVFKVDPHFATSVATVADEQAIRGFAERIRESRCALGFLVRCRWHR